MTTSYELNDSGLYAPTPRGVRAIQLTGIHASQSVVGDDIEAVSEKIDAFLDGAHRDGGSIRTGDWMLFRDPLFGEDVIMHSRFLVTLQGIGYTWIDHEEVRLAQREREAAVRNARKSLR
jgi:hypothetical protein